MAARVAACAGPVAFFADTSGNINTKYALLESDNAITVHVMRAPATGPATVEWTTRDGTAKGSAASELFCETFYLAERKVLKVGSDWYLDGAPHDHDSEFGREIDIVT